MTTVARRGVTLPPHLQGLFQSVEVKAGVLAGATYPQDTYTDHRTGKQVVDRRGGMPVAVIAQALEFGHGQNHPRPFLQSTYANQGDTWAANFATLLQKGASAQSAADTVGARMVEDIQQTIRDWPADNSPEWAAVKGFNHGLIQTNHLTNSIAFASTVIP